MPKYAAFLRGINVSNRRANKDQLRSCFEALGYEEVTTFRASGNVIFVAGRESLAAMTARIEQALVGSLGSGGPSLLHSARGTRAVGCRASWAGGGGGGRERNRSRSRRSKWRRRGGSSR